MGNFITDTLGKIASNVTQSVISALIVTAVTTYLIVSPGKKDKTEGASGADSARSSLTVPGVKAGPEGETSPSTQEPMQRTNPEKMDAGKSMDVARETKTVAVPAADGKKNPRQTESPTTTAAAKAYKELPIENPTEQNLEPTITQGRAKGDSLLKSHPQNEKAKEVKKEEKKETKDVKKRADEVFDELDQETQK